MALITGSIEELKAMFYYNGENGGHIVLLFQEESRKATTLFHLPEDAMESSDVFQPVDIVEKCFCAAAVETLAG